jgi:hypothetical protein
MKERIQTGSTLGRVGGQGFYTGSVLVVAAMVPELHHHRQSVMCERQSGGGRGRVRV